jgi:hypothetical protein
MKTYLLLYRLHETKTEKKRRKQEAIYEKP